MKKELKKGDVLRLPLKEIRTENKKSYFIVVYEDREYAISMFEFQKSEPKQDMMTCIVKEVNSGRPVFIQDFSIIYKRFYTEGCIYTFLVRRDCTNLATSYYEVSDWNGLVFRLMNYGTTRLYEGQRVRCRVRSLVDNRLVLELTDEKTDLRNIPLLGIDDVLEEVSASPVITRWFKHVFKKHVLLKDAREAFLADNEAWLLHTVRVIDENIDVWVKYGSKWNSLLLDTYRKVCLFLLEESDFLSACAEGERKSYQKMLSRAAMDAESYMKAIKLMEENKHIHHIDVQLTKMKKSGYLFKPDKRLRELMYIFTLSQGLMQQKMQLIFDIIIGGNKENWMNEPFRSAFVEMLDLYITETRKNIDRLANIEDAHGKDVLEKLIQALAIQLLLATEKDDFDRQVSRSMLYRYLTYVDGGKKDVLLEKSFQCLSEASFSKMEFGWNEIKDLTLLAIKLSSESVENGQTSTNIMQTYLGKKAQLQMTNGHVLIMPESCDYRLVPQIPSWMLPWNKVQISVPNSDVQALTPDTRNLSDYQKWWKSVEYNLFNGTAFQPSSKGRKYRPDKGDTVYIRITGADPTDEEYLLCTVEDNAYEGKGRISRKEIVRYYVKMDLEAFIGGGRKPYLLQAKVCGSDKNGNLLFSMMEGLDNYIRQCLDVGTIVRCVVMEKYKKMYLCISEYGYSVQIPITSDVPNVTFGNYIEVNIENIRSNGIIEGSFVRQIIENFSVQDAFANLIYGYSDDKYYEENEDEKDFSRQEVMLEEEYVYELVHIIDRKAVLDRDYIRTYNYLNVARVVSMLIGNEDLAGYYDERMKLLQMLQDFAINGRVDNTMLFHNHRLKSDMIMNYPLLQTRMLELQAISCLDMPDYNPFLWDILNTTLNIRLRDIAKLVLSYNMLVGFNMFDQREAIKAKLNEILNIDMKTERPRYFGREDLHTEFKSSLVFPAGSNMKPNLKLQTVEIMKIVCGMLNAEGGVVYIGVNNEGVACGIEEDLPYFKNGSLDSFDLHVRNNIAQLMGTGANSYVKTVYPDAGKKTVYALEIQPSPYPVKLEDVYYVRQGSSTWPVMGQDLEQFLHRKEMAISQLGMVSTPAIEADTDVQKTEESKPTTKDAFNYHDDSQIATSRIRQNPIHDWEDGYGEDTLCYLHLMPKNEYMLTEEQCWDDVLLSLAVNERERDGYIVLVYSSGRITKVPVAELLDKTFRSKYKRNNTEDLFFACPATPDDALLIVFKDGNDNNCYRLDDIANLKEGNMFDKGELLTNVCFKEIVACDIIPKNYHASMKKIHNLRNTNLGNMITPQWAPSETAVLTKLGIANFE